MRRLLAFSQGPDFVCYRYRLGAFAAALDAGGWHLELLGRPRTTIEFAAALQRMRGADAVVVQRRLLDWPKATLVRQAARTLIYDVDDAVFCRDSNDARSPAAPLRWRRFRRMVRLADATLAGSSHLVAEAARCTEPGRVHRVPTCVDPHGYTRATHDSPAGTARLVWIGSRSTMPSLVEARECLEAAAAAVPGMSLTVICDACPDLGGIPLLARAWSEATEAQDLATADIGIAWLPDHPWSLGKCGLKVLQYMAAGLPVVANGIGIHRALIEHGVTGYLADTPAEWRAAIHTLAESPTLRQRMGAAARARVDGDWSVRAWGPRLAAILTHAADGRAAARRRTAA